MGSITTELIEQTKDARGRTVRTVEEREAYVRAYRDSGLTQQAFARREGIKYTTFVSWVQAAARAGASGAKFAEVTMPVVARGAVLEVCLAGGVVVRGENAGTFRGDSGCYASNAALYQRCWPRSGASRWALADYPAEIRLGWRWCRKKKWWKCQRIKEKGRARKFSESPPCFFVGRNRIGATSEFPVSCEDHH